MKKKFYYLSRLKSFIHAFHGLKILLKEEPNARIHFAIAIVVVIAGFYFRISTYEWFAVIFAIGLVFAVEIINSAIERLADFISHGRHDKIKKIKDLSAAAVLVSAAMALITGLIIFIPKILELF